METMFKRCTMTELGLMLNIGRTTLYSELRQRGYLQSQKHNLPYRKHVLDGLFEVKITDGGYFEVKVTIKGQKQFKRELCQ